MRRSIHHSDLFRIVLWRYHSYSGILWLSLASPGRRELLCSAEAIPTCRYFSSKASLPSSKRQDGRRDGAADASEGQCSPDIVARADAGTTRERNSYVAPFCANLQAEAIERETADLAAKLPKPKGFEAARGPTTGVSLGMGGSYQRLRNKAELFIGLELLPPILQEQVPQDLLACFLARIVS